MQKGMTANHYFSNDRIERLEEIGFEWEINVTLFEKRYHELIAFKEKFGHCNVPRRYANNPSLGSWSSNMRTAHRRMQKGMKITRQDRASRRDWLPMESMSISKCCTHVNTTTYYMCDGSYSDAEREIASILNLCRSVYGARSLQESSTWNSILAMS